MAITTYTELKAAVATWLGRTDMTTVIPDLIRLAEADIARTLRADVVIDDFQLASSEGDYRVALPEDCAELRSLRLNTTSYKHALTQVTVEALADLRWTGTGIPQYYAVADDFLMLDIMPSSDMDAEIVYYEKLVPLSDDTPTNNTLTKSPDIYLFGALKEAAPYLEHDERVVLWEGKYAKAVQDESNARERSELGAAPKMRRLPVVFG